MSDIKTNLRMPETLYDQVKLLAEEDMRSINAQLVILIKEAVAARIRRQKEEEAEEAKRQTA